MQGASELSATFLAHTKVRLDPPPDAAELGHLLTRVWQEARAKWPTVELAPELFVRHLAERLPIKAPADPIGLLLERMHMADLYLACACLHGIPAAIEAFELHYLSKLRKLLVHRKLSASGLDESRELTRVKILVSPSEGPPKIAEYNGQGSLLGWVRAIALRISIRQQEANDLGIGEDPDNLLDMLSEPGAALEMDVLLQRLQMEVFPAMREAFATLPEVDRYLLRLYYVDKLSMYELASRLRVSQPTISRRLASAREQIDKETRRRVRAYRRDLKMGAEPYELIILKPDLDQLQLGYEPERAQARLAAVTPEAYLFRVGLEAIAHYDWARHGLALTAEATAGLLQALADESRSSRPHDWLTQLSNSLGWGNDLEHALYTRGFLVALDGVPRYGGIFLSAMSQQSITFPVMRATLAAGQATFYQLPIQVPFVMWDPGAGASPPAAESVAREMQADWEQQPIMRLFVRDMANSQHAHKFRALINDPQVHALLVRTGKLGRGRN